MRTNTKLILFGVFLAFSLFTFQSCKRDAVEEPMPMGPSTFAVLLKLNASPNVIFAGLQDRQMSTITASLKKYDGAAIANHTVYFEVVDQTGKRLDVGFFNSNMAVFSHNTDGNGNVTVNYYGPLSDEIADNGILYIRATVAWQGAQFIIDNAPLYVIRNADDIMLEVKAIPDLIYAGEIETNAEIRATVFSGGAPLVNCPVYFLLNTDLGRFIDGKWYTSSNTNDNGVATKTYVCPGFWGVDPLNPIQTVSITVQVTQQVSKDVTIKVIRGR